MSFSAASYHKCRAALISITTLLALAACAVAQDKPDRQSDDSRTDENGIRQMIAKYAKSIDEADTTLASQVWLDSPDVSFIHPLGHEHGFDQIKQNVYRHLMGDIFSERSLSTHDISVHVYGDAAWAEFYWDFAAKLRKDGSPVITHGRESQVYRRTPQGWRLVHVHYSGMPATEERKGF
jgi:ketosteroid isomerase-like protein